MQTLVLPVEHISQKVLNNGLWDGVLERDQQFRTNKVCGLACISMIVNYFFHKKAGFYELLKYKNKYYNYINFKTGTFESKKCYIYPIGWLHYGLIKIIGKEFNLYGTWENIGNDFIDKIYGYLSEDILIVASVGLNFDGKSKNGHLVLIKGLTNINGKIHMVINDPEDIDGSKEINIDVFQANFSGNIVLFSQKNIEKFISSNPINIDFKDHKTSDLCLVGLHENETLAYDNINFFSKEKQLSKLLINQNQERFIRVYSDNQCFRLDPNRTFTDQGIECTIRDLNLHMDEKNFEGVYEKGKIISNIIKQKLEKFDNILALHNNKLMNINDFVGKTNFININHQLPTNFIIITNRQDYFDFFKEKNFNVVLKYFDNDGSLLDFVSNNGKGYICIESGFFDSHQKDTLDVFLKLKNLGK